MVDAGNNNNSNNNNFITNLNGGDIPTSPRPTITHLHPLRSPSGRSSSMTADKNHHHDRKRLFVRRIRLLIVAVITYLLGISSGMFLCGMMMEPQHPTDTSTTMSLWDTFTKDKDTDTDKDTDKVKDKYNSIQRSERMKESKYVASVGSNQNNQKSSGNGMSSNVESSSSSSSSSSSLLSTNTNTTITRRKRLIPPVTRKHQAKADKMKLIVGTPIIVVGMMKAGTTSIFGYFRCGLQKQDDGMLTHYDCKPDINNRQKIRMTCGKRMRMNIQAYHQEAFNSMDQFLLYAEIDAQEKSGGMTLPQWSFLQQIHDQFPTATFVLNLRDPKKWIKSIDKWKDLRQRFIDNHYPPILPRGVGANDTDLERFYLAQAQRVRDFVKDHPTHELVEVQIDDPNAGQIMQDVFGITKDCWGVRNSNHDGQAEWKMLPDEMVQKVQK